MSRHRIRDPELLHTEYRAGAYGAVTPKDLERLRAEESVFEGRHPVPILQGTWSDGEAGVDTARILVELGLIEDQSEQGDIFQITGRGAAASFTALPAAGSTASVSASSGTDYTGTVGVLIGGTGISGGALVQIGFPIDRPDTNFGVQLTPQSADAATHGGYYFTNRTVSSVQIAVIGAPSSGDQLNWHYTITPWESL